MSYFQVIITCQTPVLMTAYLNYHPRWCSGDNQCVGSSVPVVSRWPGFLITRSYSFTCTFPARGPHIWAIHFLERRLKPSVTALLLRNTNVPLILSQLHERLNKKYDRTWWKTKRIILSVTVISFGNKGWECVKSSICSWPHRLNICGRKIT